MSETNKSESFPSNSRPFSRGAKPRRDDFPTITLEIKAKAIIDLMTALQDGARDANKAASECLELAREILTAANAITDRICEAGSYAALASAPAEECHDLA